jgi:hypothetical protein
MGFYLLPFGTEVVWHRKRDPRRGVYEYLSRRWQLFPHQVMQSQTRGMPTPADGALIHLKKVGYLSLRPAMVKRQPHYLTFLGRKLLYRFMKTAPQIKFLLTQGCRDCLDEIRAAAVAAFTCRGRADKLRPAEMTGQVEQLPADLNGGQVKEMAGRFRLQLPQCVEQAEQAALQHVRSFCEAVDVREVPKHFAGQMLQALACRPHQHIRSSSVASLPATYALVQPNCIE